MAGGARDILGGLSAVCVVSSAAAAEPRVVRIDDGGARLMRAGGIGMPAAAAAVSVETRGGARSGS
ncbi:MAG: hypothetical protein V3R75_03755 [Alphaproteobacteria bacterium]